jgi:hypothetical protein
MKKMVGEIGSLKQNDEQVGGFKHWTVVYNPPHSKVVCSQYWFFRKVEGTLRGEFYADNEQGLKLIREEDCFLTFPGCELDTLITNPLEINFLKEFDWREP